MPLPPDAPPAEVPRLVALLMRSRDLWRGRAEAAMRQGAALGDELVRARTRAVELQAELDAARREMRRLSLRTARQA